MKARSVILLLFLVGTSAHSMSLCDYRPSELVGRAFANGIVGGGALVSGAGSAMRTAGLYAIRNATTGAFMLGSTSAGFSAAATVGILPGTAGVVGAVGTALMSPTAIVGGTLLAGGVLVYEGACSWVGN